MSPKHTISSPQSTRGTFDTERSSSSEKTGPRHGGGRVEADDGAYVHTENSMPDDVHPPEYTDGQVPWVGATWWHPQGWSGDGATSQPDRYMSAPTTLLGSYLGVAYGQAKCPGICGVLKVSGDSNLALIVFFFSHGELDSIDYIDVNGKDISTVEQTDNWLVGYHSFLGQEAGITAVTALGARNYLNDFSDFATYPNLAGVAMKVYLGHENFPGSFNVFAKVHGKNITPLAGGAKTTTSTPAVILNDIITDTEQWRGLSAGFFTNGDWSWLKDEAEQAVFADGVKRWEFNGLIESRDSNEALSEVLAHMSSSLMHVNNKFVPVPDWKPKPIRGTWVAVASDTLTGTDGAAQTQIEAGERVYIDGDDGTLRTVVTVGGNNSITIDSVITLTATNYGNKVRPISTCHVEVEEWIKTPEGADTPLASQPDIVKTNYHTLQETDQLTARSEDPDGYDPGSVRITEMTLSGCAYPGQAERMGHVIRRIAAFTPFSWTAAVAPSCDIGNLLPGDVFTIDTVDGLTRQACLLLDMTFKADAGYYEIGFREYDFACYNDDATSDDDTPIDVGDTGNLTPPDAPSSLTQKFVYSGNWDAYNEFQDSDDLTWFDHNDTDLRLTYTGEYTAFQMRTATNPKASSNTITWSLIEYSRSVQPPEEAFVTFLYRTNPGYTFDAGGSVALEYESGASSPPSTLRLTIDLTPVNDTDNLWRLFVAVIPVEYADQYHRFTMHFTGFSSPLSNTIIDIKKFFIGPALPSLMTIRQRWTWTEHANADLTVSQYQLWQKTATGIQRFVASVPTGTTTMVAVSAGSSIIVAPAFEVIEDMIFKTVGPGGNVISEPTTQTVLMQIPTGHEISRYLLDWDETSIGEGRLASVGSDGLTKEYQTPGTVVTRALVTVTSIDDTDSPYTALITDQTIICDTTNGEVVVQLPAVASYIGKSWRIKRYGGNSVTVLPDGSETIDGDVEFVIAADRDSNDIEGAGHALADWTVG